MTNKKKWSNARKIRVKEECFEWLSTTYPISKKVLSDMFRLYRIDVDNPVLEETDGIIKFFIFYLLHKTYNGEVGVTLGITFFCSIASPCISHVYCSGVISATSLVVLGH